MSQTTLVWFRNDLRIEDHPALAAAARAGAVVPVYIYDPLAAGRWAPGGASRWWLEQSLIAFMKSLERLGSRLILRSGDTVAILRDMVSEVGAGAVHWTRCYEPWAIALDQRVRAAFTGTAVEVKQFRGALLVEPDAVTTGTGGYFKVYSPFARAARAQLAEHLRPVAPTPGPLMPPHAWPASERLSDWHLTPRKLNWTAGLAQAWQPGEAGAQARLDNFIGSALRGYRDRRDFPGEPSTSRLSPHLRFGEISPAAAWRRVTQVMADDGKRATGGGDKFLSELLWREFSTHLLFHTPTLPEAPFRPEFAAFPWASDARGLALWQRGVTGYPIVDAGMRELWHTGWMHNRVRMIAASFLIKDLLVPWQDGAAWFWDTLVDADLANNSASWQWVAGSGADAAPYFRIFNPVTQGQKFDPDGAYVRRWVPELAKLGNEDLHAPWQASERNLKAAGITLGETYPVPIVDHSVARNIALAAFERIKKAQ